MSAKQQDSVASRQAPKLPQFPARKTSSTSVGQSPGKRNRVESLPGVVPPGRLPGRSDSTEWARSGAAKLLNLDKRSNTDSYEDDMGDTEGFASPRLAKARAQVARDEVLSYMHHRRYQRKVTADRVDAPEPRDTSFDQSDGGDDRGRSGALDTAPRASPAAGDPAQLLHLVQQALDSWPPQGRQTADSSFADDDLRPTSTDQSPTRHSRGFLEESGGSVTATAAAGGQGKRQGGAGDGGGGRNADSSTGFSKVDDPGRPNSSVAGQASGGECASLSEDAFEFFKKEIAARVIQTHWRRWQRWKAKVRRDAEERILQQLLSDDSGLSLRILLSSGGGSVASAGGGSSGNTCSFGGPGGGITLGQERASGSNTSSTGAPPPSAASVRPATSTASGAQQQGRTGPLGRPSTAGGGGVLGSLGEDRRAALARPASAAAAQAANRGKSPARGRVTAPAAAYSPARGHRQASERPGVRGGSAGVSRGLSFASDEFASEDPQSAADGGGPKASVQPSKRHVGGHAVYTFPATPQKQRAGPPPPSGAAAPAPATGPAASSGAGNNLDGRPRGRDLTPEVDLETVCRPSSSTIAADDDASVALGSSAAVTTCTGSESGTAVSGGGAGHSNRRPAIAAQPGRSPLSPAQQQQASLDADTNPVMASPALSAATEVSAGDSALCGPGSPMPSSVVESSSQPRSQSTAAAPADQQQQHQNQPRRQLSDSFSLSQGTRAITAGTQHSSTATADPAQPLSHQQQQRQQHHPVPHGALSTTSTAAAQQSSTASAQPMQHQPQRQHTPSQGNSSNSGPTVTINSAQQHAASSAHQAQQHPQQRQPHQHRAQADPEQRPYSRAGAVARTSPPASPTQHQTQQPTTAPPQQDQSPTPSPQRQARMEALQRLKLQGSLRAGGIGTNGPARNASALAPTAAPGPSSARPLAEAPQPGQPGAFRAFLKEQAQAQGSRWTSSHEASGGGSEEEVLPRLTDVGDSWEAGVSVRSPGQPAGQTTTLSPRELRARRQAWCGHGQGPLETDSSAPYQQPQNSEERGLAQPDREPQQTRQTARQGPGGGDSGGGGGLRTYAEEDSQPRQQQAAAAAAAIAAPEEEDLEEAYQELSEEASLRALHEARTAAAASHRRQSSGHAPRLQPPPQAHESGALTPRGWGPEPSRAQGRFAASPRNARYNNAVDQPPLRPQQQPNDQPQQHHHHEWPQEPQHQQSAWGAHRTRDMVGERPDLLTLRNPPETAERNTGQPAAGNRGPGSRPLSATAAETARSRDTPPARFTIPGDDGSLTLLGNTQRAGQLRDGAAPRHTGRGEAPAAVAWPESSGRRAGRPDPADQARERPASRPAAGTSGRGAGGEERSADGSGLSNPGAGRQSAGGANSLVVYEGSAISSRGGRPSSSMGPSTEVLSTAVSGGAGDGGRMVGAGGANGADPQVTMDASVTAEKMSSILKYLEEVELQAEQEATCVSLAPGLLVAETPAPAAAALLPGSTLAHHHHHQHRGGGPGTVPPHSHTQRYHEAASATSTGTRQVTGGSSRPGTAHTGTSQLGGQRSAAVLSDAGTALHRSRRRTRSHRRSLAGAADDDASEAGGHEGGEDDDDACVLGMDDDTVSVGTRSTFAGHANRPAFLAESVYENVRSKIRRLQDDVKQRDARISELTQEIESLQAAQRTVLLDADARLTEMLAAQRAEYEAAVSRHMAFVDRLLADKEALAARSEQLTEQLKAADERQERAISKLKEGWAAELKRQKESWAAAEKQRREAWMQSKAAEIKDVTVKGLEGEVQKLLERHRAELAAAQKAAADEAKRHLDTYVAQNEAAVRQLKERMAREAEEAVEKERAAAATRLREVSERYEQQLQTQRMRLVSDADLRLEQLEQARKEDKKRYEEAVAAAKEAGEARLKDAEEDWRREKDAVRKAHEKQIDALREQYETGQEGWRAAMAERARKEVHERVAAIREKLLQERNEEVQAVMTRLEAEHAAAVEALKEDFRRREEASAARAASALKEARRAEAKMAERFRSAGMATKTAEERLATSEMTISDLRRELEARNNTIHWLEAQVSSAKDEAAARERDVRSLGAEKAAVAAEVAAAVARDKQQVEARLAQALQDAQELRSRHSAEMAAVEARVRATLARKDEAIAGLREQLAAMAAELRNTQEVLRKQQEELGSELSGSGGSGSGIGISTGRDLYGGDAVGRRGGRY